MSHGRYALARGLLVAGSFAGSYVANRAVIVAHAQDGPSVRAAAFTLVDSQGKTQATLRGGRAGAELILNDDAGRMRVEVNASGVVVRDRNGRVEWSSPHGTLIPANQ